MLTSWLQRSAGYTEASEPTVEDLLPEAARCLQVGVVVDPLSYMALTPVERQALALAHAAIALDADEETWADRAREGFAQEVRGGK